MTTRVPTPELDKQSALVKSGKAATVQEFIDWLSDDQHLQPCAWQDSVTETIPCEGDGKRGCRNGKRVYDPGTPEEEVSFVDCYECDGDGVKRTYHPAQWVPDARSRLQLMADFFGIDLDRIEQERRAVLAALNA